MKVNEQAAAWGKTITAMLGKYKFVLLIILVGIVLLALPSGEKQAAEKSTAAVGESISFDVDEMEQKLSEALSKIEGAGETRVLLTLQSGSRTVLAQDSNVQQKDNEYERETSTVTISKGSSTQETVAVQEIAPQFLGAVVICPGGGNPAVCLKLTEAVSALTGLGADRISVCKGNQ
ncbi:MAG: stage III sporulation protein AG [Oscillospiraceae bacterium]|nr:stage III sporulation protein AG [Oscillospiraceae bacterium]